jgi:hypothetical protein
MIKNRIVATGVMKIPNIKSVLLFVVFALLSFTSVRAQTERAAFVDFSGNTYAVLASPWRTFHDVGGRRGFDIPIDAFAGADTFGVPVAGFKISANIAVAREFSFTIGPAYAIRQGTKPFARENFGIFVGVKLTF